MFGFLKVQMFVTLPGGRDRKVTVASIPCDYDQREVTFRKFIDLNNQLWKASCHATWVCQEMVDLHR